MMGSDETLAQIDLARLSDEKVREVARDLQSQICSLQQEVNLLYIDVRKQRKIMSTLSDGNAQAEGSTPPARLTWTLSDNHYPKPNSSVIHFDGRNCSVKNTDDLYGKCSLQLDRCLNLTRPDDAAIVSKIPSRWTNTVYLYADNTRAIHADSCLWVTSKKGQSDGLRWMSTIHFGKLPIEIRVQVLFGQIQWLFITENGSRSSTESSA
jgi:hypothetical protein